jgi:two-component system CheB/CheR fusion protein
MDKIARGTDSSGAAEAEVRLPLTDKPLAEVPAPEKCDQTSSHRSVLIVEDNVDSRNLLRELLQMDGFEVLVAEDGTSGLRAIEGQRPDVALIDIGLPGISGYEVAKSVRTKLGNDQIQLVALTGYGRAEDRRAVRAAGFDEHLVKPLDLDELHRVLRKPR